jgi:hypothetical protein
MSDLDELPFTHPDAAGPSFTGAAGRRAKPAPDPERQRRNRNNRKRGKSTSRDLADYLGWQNVEGLNWPWDIQGPGGRIQSKRELRNYGPAAALALIEYIPSGDYLRGLFYVAPRARLTSGEVICRLEDWVNWHGWAPMGAVVAAPGAWLVRLPLPLFRDVHCARREAA